MSVQSGWFWDESFTCATSASLASKQYYLVSLSTGTTLNNRAPMIVCPNSSSGVAGALGVLQEPSAVGVAGTVRLAGISKIVASTTGAVTQGSLLTSNASGQACVADSTGQRVIGICLAGFSAAQADGATVEALLTRMPNTLL